MEYRQSLPYRDFCTHVVVMVQCLLFQELNFVIMMCARLTTRSRVATRFLATSLQTPYMHVLAYLSKLQPESPTLAALAVIAFLFKTTKH